MRKLFYVLISSIVLCCTEEWNYPQSFPIVLTSPEVNVVSMQGAEVSATVKNAKDIFEVVSYGFVWGTSDPSETDHKMVVGTGILPEEFSAFIDRDLAKGPYTVRAFVRLNDIKIVYGSPIGFASQGVAAPIIEKVEPADIFGNENITITGDHFGTDAWPLLVDLAEFRCSIVSVNDSVMTVRAPETSQVKDATLKVTLYEQTATAPVRLAGPQILTLSSLSGKAGEKILITGEHFKRVSYFDIVLTNGSPTGFAPRSRAVVISDTQAEFTVPATTHGSYGLYLISQSPHKVSKHSHTFEVLQ